MQTVKCSYLVIKICGVVKFCTHVFRDNLITVTYLIALLRVKGNEKKTAKKHVTSVSFEVANI